METKPDAPELSGRQRRQARALAHPLRPLVHVGEDGITPGVVGALDRALLDHELVKVRLHEPESKKTLARSLAEASHAAFCGLVGHTVILYRPHPETPRISLSADAIDAG